MGEKHDGPHREPVIDRKTCEDHASEDKRDELFHGTPLYDFLYPFRPAGSQWLTEYSIVIFAIVVRSAVGLGDYSGRGSPPMHGDFEAQRHWMEITQHLPISQWYWYDLQYWGLDYPPLTAYHSLLMGKIGAWFGPAWFALDSSRGIETPGLHAFMRFTVLISEALCYIPAIVYFTKWWGRAKRQTPTAQFICAAAMFFQPSLLCIDHGHFQYNSVMLGFALCGINCLLDEFYALASVCFVLSLCFKQMALYYAPIFFAYLLGRCFVGRSGQSRSFQFPRLLGIATATVTTFGIIYAPLYILGGGLPNLKQSIMRIFPFNRGIFEDKVANFWCVTNVLYKYKTRFTVEELKLYSLLLTVAGFLPSMIITLIYPRKHLIPYALAACSMAFYLFSFQVHEKTILLPLMPITLLYISTNWNTLAMVSWINNVAMFTLWPLLKKDGLALQYAVTLLLSNWLIGNFSFATPRFLPQFMTPGPSVSSVEVDYRRRSLLPQNIVWKLLIIGSYISMGVYHYLDFTTQPPDQYPDLWIIFNCAIGFVCFTLFWFWANWQLLIYSRAKTVKDL